MRLDKEKLDVEIGIANKCKEGVCFKPQEQEPQEKAGGPCLLV
jgi:hypothetical protein